MKIAGITIAASRVKAKATYVTVMCKNCKNVQRVACRPGLGGAIVPRSCGHVPQVYLLLFTYYEVCSFFLHSSAKNTTKV